jgi:hypothetical protein
MNEPKYLFLDDKRLPADCIIHMEKKNVNTSVCLRIVRSSGDFVNWIEQNGLPDIILFDQDPEETGKRGIDAAKWLVNYCFEKDLALPPYILHSMNPVDAENIKALFENYTGTRKSEKHRQKDKKQPGEF